MRLPRPERVVDEYVGKAGQLQREFPPVFIIGILSLKPAGIRQVNPPYFPFTQVTDRQVDGCIDPRDPGPRRYWEFRDMKFYMEFTLKILYDRLY